jgi:hypothetical protein
MRKILITEIIALWLSLLLTSPLAAGRGRSLSRIYDKGRNLLYVVEYGHQIFEIDNKTDTKRIIADFSYLLNMDPSPNKNYIAVLRASPGEKDEQGVWKEGRVGSGLHS